MDGMPRLHQMMIDGGTDTLYAELVTRGSFGETPAAGHIADTVVFCHGLGGNHASWFQQVPHFAADFRVLTWDQRGFGNSSNRAGLASPAQAVTDLRRIVEETNAGRVHLVGQSMGGWAALGYTLAFPDDVASVVLSDSLGGMFTDASRAAFDAHIEAREAAASVPPHLGANAAVADELRRRQPDLALLFQEIGSFTPQPPPDMLGMLRKAEVSIDTVARLDIPMLFVLGEADHIFPPAAARDIVDRIPGARLCLIPHAGHSAYFERADRFNSALAEHLLRNRHG